MSRESRLPLVLAIAVLAAYANSFSGAMLFDDHGSIINNPTVHDLSAAWSACLAGADYRPLTTLSLALNHSLGVLDPWGYHAFNISVHVLAALALFGLIRRTLLLPRWSLEWRAGAERFAFAVALLWAIHPLQTESVTYIVQRAQCLAGLFLLLMLYGLLRSLDSPNRFRWQCASVVSCAMGMASKQDMVVAPLIALAFDRIFLAGSWAEVIRKRWPLHVALLATWLVLAPSIRVAIVGLPAAAAPENASPNDRSGVTAGFALARITPRQYAMTQPGSILHYLRSSLRLEPLCLDYYDWPIVRSPSDVPGVPLCCLIVLLGGTLHASFARPAVGFLGLFFFLALAPTSSILPIDDAVAERRMYLPLAAAIALLALAWRIAGDGLEKRGILAANVRRTVDSTALAVVALLLGAATFARNEDYRSQVAMWTEAASTRPSNARAWHNLAVALVDEDRRSEAVEPFRTAARLKPDAGQYAALAQCLMEIGRPGEAAVEFQKALELLPVSRGSLRSTPASLHFDLATALVDANRPERVEEHLRESLRLEPANAPARNVLGLVLARQSKYDEAVVELRRAIELEPGFIAARDNLGTVHFKSGNLPAAIAAYETALALHPDASRVIHNLAHAYFRLGNRERAESHFREGRRLDPNGARVAARSAWVLACHSDAVRRDPVEAVRLAELAVEATNRRDPICLDAAATAYAAMGRFNDAVDEARTARDLIAPVDPRAAAAIASRLRLYERGEAYRDPP